MESADIFIPKTQSADIYNNLKHPYPITKTQLLTMKLIYSTLLRTIVLCSVIVTSLPFSLKAIDFDASYCTNTLPVIYINTENAAPIVNKVDPIPATLYITTPENSDYKSLGSPEEGIELTIRGRGNASWNWPKKPYKLKFSSKTEVLGLPKSKHFALLHHNQGYVDYLASMAGMEFARRIGEPWAPHIIPVELVLNGSYEGLYFLAETVKIDKKRVNIFEQEDQTTDPNLIPYGWLIEIDNYTDECQITLPETNSMNLRVTYHSPEDLSTEQSEWLTDEFTSIIESLYSPSDSTEPWYDKIDINSAARYFIVRELFHDYDAYNGSFYMHRDKGEDAKWYFGPIWDITLCSTNKTDWVLNDHPNFAQCHLIQPIMNSPLFKKAVCDIWDSIYPETVLGLQDYVNEIATICEEADKTNKERWPDISSSGTKGKARHVNTAIVNNSKWINDNLDALSAIEDIVAPTYEDECTTPEYYNLMGIKIENPSNGVFIMKKGSTIAKIIK